MTGKINSTESKCSKGYSVLEKNNKLVRVRFAPSPTGMMHIGNIRTALFNYLFAKKTNGTFILRVEDTDPKRNFDPGAKKIQENLKWLGLDFTEGPELGGPHGPYFQSQRIDLYKKALEGLILGNKVYRCFCTEDELSRKRERQISLKVPPRYDRTCKELSSDIIDTNLSAKKEFVWRAIVNHADKIELNDLARGKMSFDLKNFSDFPLTRKDGSTTFMFANVVDDNDMQITHVFRGEDHLTNTVGQIVLYNAMGVAHPIYWHMPILCNSNGKKLSKRDFGFSLDDLQKAGFLSSAINNYLATTGSSFKQEIMSLPELIQEIDFDHISSTGQIKYDPEKLRWINHKWIAKLDVAELSQLVLPYIATKHPEANKLSNTELNKIAELIQTDLVTLADSAKSLDFYFSKTVKIDKTSLQSVTNLDKIVEIIKNNLPITDADSFLTTVKKTAKDQKIPLKEVFPTLRNTLTGSPQGFSIKGLINTLGTEISTQRFESFIKDIS
jgi:glutamyl-tRNA synthetase